MRKTKFFLSLFFILVTMTVVLGQDTLYFEYFTDGSLTLNWFTPWEGGNNMEVDYWEGNPSGDNWVGFVGNTLSGGNVGTTLSGELGMADYDLQAQIYCTVNTSAYHGLISRCDTSGGVISYYSLRTDFDSDQRIQLRKFPGDTPPYQGQTIAQWVGSQIPGGVPTQDRWHLMRLKCEGDQLYAYWDGTLLSGCPYTDSYADNGFFGVYVFRMAGEAETYCDDIIVLGEAGPQPIDLMVIDNHFLDEDLQEMILAPAVGQTIYFRLDWQTLNGQTTTPPFVIKLEMDNVEIFSQAHPGVEPNTLYSTTSSAWSAELGEHTLRWTLDANNTIVEGNEENNILEDTFLVLPTTAYDLQADSSWVADSDTNEFSVSPVVEDEVLFALFWSAPMGQGFSGAFNITMELDGQPYFLSTMFGASQGQNYMTVTQPWIATSGFHYYFWEIDPDNWVDEFNENNNSIMDGFEVVTGGGVRWGNDQMGFLPEESRISGVYPNPFNPTVTLRYEISQPGMIRLVIYDANGREVIKLFDGFAPLGAREVSWEAKGISSGTYFAVLEAGGKRSVKPLLFVK